MTTNAENLRQCKSRLSLIVEQIFAFALSSTLMYEVNNFFPNFKFILVRLIVPWYDKSGESASASDMLLISEFRRCTWRKNENKNSNKNRPSL